MKRRMVVALALLAGALLPAAAQAQIGVAGRAGTLGVGGEVSFDVMGRWLAVRGGVGSFLVQPKATVDSVQFTLKPPSTIQNVGVDLYPGGKNFRLSAGLMFKHDVAVDATPQSTYDINGHTYSSSQVGTISGTFTWKTTAPYASFGFAGRGRGLGLSLDFGAAYMGEPVVAITTTSTNSSVQSDVQAEQGKVQDKANKYGKILPILSLGLRFGI